MPPKPKTDAAPQAPMELRNACIVAAREVIAERGIENLSLRDVARKLGVSHQAPYKHYPSRDHLLTEVLRRCFQHFSAHLDDRPPCDDPREDLRNLGMRYLGFAHAHPLEYRLMFSTTWPEAAKDAGLMEDGNYAFDILRKVLQRLHGTSARSKAKVDLDAIYIWSTMHGLSGLMSSNSMGALDLQPGVLAQAVAHAMERIELGLAARP
jgi:AcrR family transcriptional regulator